MFLYPITKWQRLSYNSDAIGCQYSPNCSLYGAQAIHSKGAALGSMVTYDRIIRCNESAAFHHNKMGGFYSSDNRLVDPVDYFPSTNKKSPLFAATLSAIVPGSGRSLWWATDYGWNLWLTSFIAYDSSCSKKC